MGQPVVKSGRINWVRDLALALEELSGDRPRMDFDYSDETAIETGGAHILGESLPTIRLCAAVLDDSSHSFDRSVWHRYRRAWLLERRS